MTRNPYDVLGIKKDASNGEIQKAFRRLAKKSHPDLFPGDKKAEDRFKDLNAAYDIIGDEDKRVRFDSGEIDASGAEIRRNPFAGGARAGNAHGFAGGGAQGGFAFENLSDLFGGMFRGGRAPADGGHPFGGGASLKNNDMRFSLDVDFIDAMTGAKKRLTLPGGRSLDVNIPAGISDGQTIRLKGQGGKGASGRAGDALIEVKIKPHPKFRREGHDLHIDLPVSLKEAVLGAKVEVPTVHGTLTVTVPKGSNSGSRLRLKSKGVAGTKGKAAGDQYVTLKIVLPKKTDAELEKFLKDWNNSYDPRRE
jgi:DnaJ-class molecular chaperone